MLKNKMILKVIFLLDDIEVAKKKIMSAKTDSLNQVKFDEENQPGISNLMSILSKITGESFDSIENRFKNKGYGDFKREVADVVGNLLKDIQEKYKKYNNEEFLKDILKRGAKKARRVANNKIKKVSSLLGLN